jgi:MarR family transcriptional regulator, organic hydroperoxide resistance regulator
MERIMSDRIDETPENLESADEAERRLGALKKLRILIRAAQRHSAWIEKQCGVSGAQLWVLYELGERPGMRVGELAQRLAVHQTTASNLLEGLFSRKFIKKTRDPDDQRAIKLTLSASGKKLLAKAPDPARGLFAEALAKVHGPALTSLLDGLDAMLSAVGDVDETLGTQPLPFMLQQDVQQDVQ